MDKRIKDKNKLIVFSIVAVLFFGILVKMNYSVDTYLLFASENLGYIQEYIKSGRIITALLFRASQFFRLQPEIMYTVSFVIGIICTTFSMYTLNNILKKYIKNNILNTILSIMIIINPFSIELWLFIEMGIMMLSILACVIAFKHFDKYLEEQNKKQILLSIIFMTIAMFSYQGTVAIFMALSTISIIYHSKTIKEGLKNTAWSLIIYAIPTLINFLIIMIIGNNRVGGDSNLLAKIEFILVATKERLFNGFGLYPNVIFLLIHIYAFAIVISNILISKEGLKQKLNNLLKLLYVVLVTWGFTVITIIPQNVDSLVMYPRTSYAYGSIIGIIFAFSSMCINNNEKEKYISKIIIAISIILLLIQFIQFNIIAINRYNVNNIDKNIILEIDEKISQYEKETGIEIKNIAIYNEENSKRFYDGINDMINVSAKNEELSRNAILALFAHRSFNSEQPSEKIYNEYFKDKNWTTFNLDQIVLKNDTMHWYLY